MATGYTAPIHDGEDITFEQFVLRCARAFGAAIHQRDESMDVEIREMEMDSWYTESAEKARAVMDETLARAPEEWQSAFDEEVLRAEEYNERIKRNNSELTARYEAMIAQVEAWTPPTREHYELKEFMLKQLHESLDFDVSTYRQKPPESVDSFREAEIARVTRSYANAVEALAKEQERVRSQNAWVRALRDSLSQEANK
jgi:hypothetical protein